MTKRIIIFGFLIAISWLSFGCTNSNNLKTAIFEVTNKLGSNDLKIKDLNNPADTTSLQIRNIPQPINWDKTGCDWISGITVLDGDTLKYGNEIIRLIGVDAPESDPNTGKSEFFARESKYFTEDNLKSQPICAKQDSALGNKDKYGRLLRYIYLPGGTFLNDSLVRWGYSRFVSGYFFNHF